MGQQWADRESAPIETRIDAAYHDLFQRSPNEHERRLGLAFLGDSPDAPLWSEYAQALLGSNEFLFVD